MKPRELVSMCLLFTLAISAVTLAGLSEALALPSELWTQIMACEDSFVEKAYPDWNGGDRGNIDVTHGGATPKVARTLLKFSLCSFQHTPLKAELRVFIETSLHPIDGESEIEVYEVHNDTWDEDTVTWNNMPEAHGYLLDEMSTNFPHGWTNRWLSFDVYSYVNSEFEGDRTVSFLLKCHIETESYVEPHGYSLASTEDSSGNHPELWISYMGKRDESTNPSFYDDFEDGIIDDVWLSVFNSPDESQGKLNCSNLPSGVVYRDPVNVQNSIIDIDICDEGIDNKPIICLRDRLNTSISPSQLNSHDFYYVISYRHNQTHSGWYVFRGQYNGSWAQVATNIVHQAINTTLRINITSSEIYFEEIYNNTSYDIYNETYALSTYWLYLYLFEETWSSTWTQYESFEFRKLWLTSSVRQYNSYLKNSEKPYICNSTHPIMTLDYDSEKLLFSVDARSGDTSTTRVSCGEQGKPDTVLINNHKYTEGDHWNYDYESNIVTLVWTHSSPVRIAMRWENDGPALYRLTVVVQRDGAPTEAIVNVNGENRSITGVTTYEWPQGSYSITVHCGDRVQTRQVDLFSDRSIGFNFRALDDHREDWLLIAGVPLAIAVGLALLVLFIRRGRRGETNRERRSTRHSDMPLDGSSLPFGRHYNRRDVTPSNYPPV